MPCTPFRIGYDRRARPPLPHKGSTMTTVSEILEAVRLLITQRGRERDQTNGERSMGRAVAAFNALYGHEIAQRDGRLSEADGWAFMDILKRARGRDDDSLLDGVAYRALEAECAMRDGVRRAPEDRG